MATEAKKSREGKPYQLKKSAHRAAKEDGYEPYEYNVLMNKKNEFYYKLAPGVEPKIQEKAIVADTNPVEEAPKPDPVPEKKVVSPKVVSSPAVQEKLITVMLDPNNKGEGTVRVEEQIRTIVENAQAELNKPTKPKREILHKSTVESPTKLVWAIAERMKAENPNVTRRAVMAECVRIGIAFWTARTQYQQWITAVRESEKK